MGVNKAAFFTTSSLGIATIAASIGAATATSTATTVALAALAVLGAALSIASVTAWMATKKPDTDSYFTKLQEHAGPAVAGTIQFVAQTLVQALIQGLASGLSQGIRRKIGGEDHTIRVAS